jgi:hypothetical protein
MSVAVLPRFLLVALAISLANSAVGQGVVIDADKTGSVTLDASRLNTVVALDASWHFFPGNDPHFADPNFDDSGGHW